jgi:hypothetical protein
MTVSRGRLNWGVFFIVLGAVPLAAHMGAISSSTVADAWRLWPLVIVGIGVGFVLSRTPAYFVGGMIVAATLGLVFGGLLTVGPNVGWCVNGNGPGRSITRAGTFDGAATVEINLQCGSADVVSSSDAQWHVTAFNSASNDARIDSSDRDLTVSSSNRTNWFNQGRDDWQVALPQGQEIDLRASLNMGDSTFQLGGVNLTSASFTANLGSLHVNLTGSQIDRLSVSTNLGSASVILDGGSDVTGDFRTSLGSLEICVPAELGVQVTSHDSLSSTDFGSLQMKDVGGGVWQTRNYEEATHKANFTVETSLGSLGLNGSGGCR